jgi:hypothetical protein
VSRKPWILAFCALAAGACGTPSRRLSTRAVDDPIVLPRRMIAVSLDGSLAQDRPERKLAGAVLPGIDYGLTDRLELADVLSLRYAVLDDAPRLPERIVADPFRHRPRLSLTVRAGTRAIAFSSVEGLIVAPLMEVVALEHLGDDSTVSVMVGWFAQWVSRPATLFSQGAAYDERLWSTASRQSELHLDVSTVRQLGDHLSAWLRAGLHEGHAGIAPWDPWGSRGGSFDLGAAVRPWPWLTLRAGLFAGARGRPPGAIVTAYPGQPLPRQLPASVSWLGASGGVVLRW